MNIRILLFKNAKKIRDYLCSATAVCDSFKIARSKKRVCILVSNGGNAGAPLVLLEAASIYKNNGWSPIIIAESHSRMAKLSKERGIKLWTVAHFSNIVKREISKMNVDFCLVNTVVMYDWVSFFEKLNLPTIWWIHESDEYFETNKTKLPQKLEHSILPLAVGMRPLNALSRYGFQYNPQILMYGTEDLALDGDIGIRTEVKELNVLIIGAICKRKNQLNTIKTILSFPAEMKEKFHFIIVGTQLGGEEDYFNDFQKAIENNPLFEYMGYVEREEIPKLYKKVDAVLACSVDDPLPVVVTESFMFGKISIVSSEVGQYPYIENGKNGYKYNAFDSDELKDVLIHAYENKFNLLIAQNSRNTYEMLFSKKTFTENLISYTKQVRKLS